MKNIVITIVSCVALLAAQTLQAAPQPLTTVEKNTYNQRAAALPPSFGNEQGEDIGIVVLVVGLLVIALAAVYGGSAYVEHKTTEAGSTDMHGPGTPRGW
jgi:hypothetical protein